MTKYLARAFGSYDPVDKLVALHLERLEAKFSPKCTACVIEIARGDKHLRCDEIPCGPNGKFPHKINNTLAMLSVFFYDAKDKKYQEKKMEIKIVGIVPGQKNVELGRTYVNLANFAGRK